MSMTVANSTLGSILVDLDEVGPDPAQMHICAGILDGTKSDGVALGTFQPSLGQLAYAIVTAIRSTIRGAVQVHGIELAENSILNEQVQMARKQAGGMRFCFVAPGSRTPRRHRCQPDLVERALTTSLGTGERTEEEKRRALARERLMVQPHFAGRSYGTANYARLSHS